MSEKVSEDTTKQTIEKELAKLKKGVLSRVKIRNLRFKIRSIRLSVD